MDLGLKDKRILITGACRGIGLAAAREFLQEGARVWITARDGQKLEEAAGALQGTEAAGRIMTFQGNLLEEMEIIRLKQEIKREWDGLDVIVPNIGSGKPMNQNPLDISEWQRLFEINLYGGVRLIDGFQEEIRRSRGNIVMISSIVARQIFGTSYAYAASKGSVLTLVKYLARDMAQAGVRVNCVLPGNVFFDGGRWEELLELDENGVKENIKAAVPMQRFGKAEEIAAAIVFLASSRASFITGAFLTADGGQSGIIG